MPGTGSLGPHAPPPTHVFTAYSRDDCLACSVGVGECGLIRCVHTLAARRRVGGALGREVAPTADRGSVHAGEVGGLLAVDSESFGDEYARDHTVVVATSAAHESGQVEVGVGDLCVEVREAQWRGVCVVLCIVVLRVRLCRCADLRVCMGCTVHRVMLDVRRPVVRGYSPAGPDVHDQAVDACQQGQGRHDGDGHGHQAVHDPWSLARNAWPALPATLTVLEIASIAKWYRLPASSRRRRTRWLAE